MVKRLLWLGIGIGVGVVVVRMVTKKARQFTPAALAGSATEGVRGLVDEARDFLEDVRYGMAEREDEIHRAFADGEALDGGADLSWARGVGQKFYNSEIVQRQQEG
ncbi:hypothetical protein [Hamadaea tsunoensis]|uniref:hypothetical protein n=1 Tax=Hamadaea tsunoensis TaxID=53368 RepID=UPI0004089144